MQMKNMINIVVVGLTMTMLMGCSMKGKQGWLRDRSEDYVEAKSYPAIQIPKDLQVGSFSEEYQIPEV